MFINTNGAGMGHLNRCLAYARAMEGEVEPLFLTLSSAVEIIQQFGFEADYFVSHFWSSSASRAWNRELAHRLRLILDKTRPSALVFDGTIPFPGIVEACAGRDDVTRVWSRRGGNRHNAPSVPVDEDFWDLLLEPGEIGSEGGLVGEVDGFRKVALPPVTLLQADELLDRESARKALGLASDGRYALLSLGSGNQKDTRALAEAVIRELRAGGVSPIWAQAPISVRPPSLPVAVETIQRYPLARYLRAFDYFVGAAGYNSCCELIQSGLPALLIPNRHLNTDDQAARALHLKQFLPVTMSDCEDDAQVRAAIETLLTLTAGDGTANRVFNLDGARMANAEIRRAMGEDHG